MYRPYTVFCYVLAAWHVASSGIGEALIVSIEAVQGRPITSSPSFEIFDLSFVVSISRSVDRSRCISLEFS